MRPALSRPALRFVAFVRPRSGLSFVISSNVETFAVRRLGV
jgi:hypothetical protein